MKKTILFFLTFLSSCSAGVTIDGCPVVSTLRENTRQFINLGNYDAFQITLSGNDSYCYTETSTNQRYMVITPYFKVKRLEDSSVNSVDTAFYVKTLGSSAYIGTKTYQQSLYLPSHTTEQTIKGKPISLRIAQPPYDNFSIEIGLALSDYALSKSKRMFDINYQYLSPDDLNAIEEPVNQEYLEIGPDEKIVYCEKTGKPVVVKKGITSTPCN